PQDRPRLLRVRVMHFDLTDEQKMIRETVRQFAEERLRPTAHDRDKEQRPALEEAKAFAQMGFLGMTIPEEYGGAPLDDVSEAIVIEELSRCDASVGVLVAVHCGLCSKTLVVWCNDEQKKR